jgi:(4S)-4-hydroxy-5-phosphonooxypentane-2,3-dione isomerase
MARYLMISMQIDPAHVGEVIEAYKEHGRVASETEPGLLRFDVHQDQSDPNRIILYEAYASDEAHAAHVEGASHKKARGVVDALIAQGKAKRDATNFNPVFTHAAPGR